AADSEDAAVRALAVVWTVDLLPSADAPSQRTLADLVIRLSRDSTAEVQCAAVLALGRVADPRAFERLRLLLAHEAVAVRVAAVRSLAQHARSTGSETSHKPIIPLLQRMLEDPALEVVIETAEDLGALGIAEASPVLTGLLRHPSASVRQAA